MEEEECRIAVCIRAADTGQLLLMLAPTVTNPCIWCIWCFIFNPHEP